MSRHPAGDDVTDRLREMMENADEREKTRGRYQTGRDCSRCAFRYAVGSVCATSLNACVNLPCVA